ncbi:MAG: HAMP domain-containing histidine kinase [Eubacterium sp.]|nr:HAMP domain-containing histidine kinase [Eubacterium sp.]
MKLKNRIYISFFVIVLVPLLLTGIAFWGFAVYQVRSLQKQYGIEEITYQNLSNNTYMLNKITQKLCTSLQNTVETEPDKMEDFGYLDNINRELNEKNAYLVVRKGDVITYNKSGLDSRVIASELPMYGDMPGENDKGVYIGKDIQALVKQVDFEFPDDTEGSAFVMIKADAMVPRMQNMMLNLVLIVILILAVTAFGLCTWTYHGVITPLTQLKIATKNIKEGNLDFTVEKMGVEEIGNLCEDFEEMRKRLKQSNEEKLAFDKENRELISNISHDLKTPITAVKGYVEGIMDGVADTPEKMNRYIRTIYNKANEMDRLINELTFYSKIDTNRIPYTFNKIHVKDYFEDCIDDLSVELESSGVSLTYFDYLEEDAIVIADAEQLKRVINNIISNSLKYMNKPRGVINIRLRDVGDFIQIEIEDNGKGIAQKDLVNIFDRFYRTDASRNSSKGGSGIGLSIVKKIMEDHGGQVWATSKEGTGTTMYLALRKYQEVPVHE